MPDEPAQLTSFSTVDAAKSAAPLETRLLGFAASTTGRTPATFDVGRYAAGARPEKLDQVLFRGNVGRSFQHDFSPPIVAPHGQELDVWFGEIGEGLTQVSLELELHFADGAALKRTLHVAATKDDGGIVTVTRAIVQKRH